MTRPVGRATRGTTAPNRLRRVDRWIAARIGPALPAGGLVVDLGFGAHPVTTVELYRRLHAIRPDVRVVGLEIDASRVAHAAATAAALGVLPPALTFARGGFELGGLRPVLVRAMNVLRQYEESEVDGAWAAMVGALAPGGAVVEGTCDEPGRLASWIHLSADGPRSLTLAARLSTLDTPATLAERLPKRLIHHNVPGHPVHDLMGALSAGWAAAAPYATFGARQRWIRTVEAVRASGWPVLDTRSRWRLGEVTVGWSALVGGRRGPRGEASRPGPAS
jgi:hypothetical protein